jgi:antitoxin YefM
MGAPRFSEDVRPVTDLRTSSSSIIEHARKSGRPVLLTRRGRGMAVLLDLAQYESLVDRAAFVDGVEAARKAVAAGRVRDNEEAMAILDKFGKSHE